MITETMFKTALDDMSDLANVSCNNTGSIDLHAETVSCVFQKKPVQTLASVTVTVTVTKVFILHFLLKDRKCITESFTYIQRSPG